MAGGQVLTVDVAANGVPANATAVMFNLTVVGPSAGNYVVAYPSGSAQPFASNVNAFPGQVVPNLVVSKIGPDGNVSLGNQGGDADLLVDVIGWFDEDRSSNAGRFLPMDRPFRRFDTRTSIGEIESGGYVYAPFADLPPTKLSIFLPVLGRTGSMVLNVTAIGMDGAGYVTVYPDDLSASPPYVSNLNVANGQTVANTVVSRVGNGSDIHFRPTGATVHLLADISGFFTNEHF